ncbi:histidine kinase [Streptomyces flavidovirens]|uniref:sensor histidine kinase n=1 Tax=Streptomyces flavidovirens TaxID=67298 RepID=UPI0034203A51
MNELAQRNRLAQELHDSIGHTLTASTIQAAVAGQLMDCDPEAARRALNSIEENALPAGRRGRGGLSVETVGDLAHVPATVSREAYRIIQEGLTNALRHSDMTGISLHITARHDWLEMELINPVDTPRGTCGKAGSAGTG